MQGKSDLRPLLDSARLDQRALTPSEINENLTFADDVTRTERQEAIDGLVLESETIAKFMNDGMNGHARRLILRIVDEYDQLFASTAASEKRAQQEKTDAMTPRELADEINNKSKLR